MLLEIKKIKNVLKDFFFFFFQWFFHYYHVSFGKTWYYLIYKNSIIKKNYVRKVKLLLDSLWIFVMILQLKGRVTINAVTMNQLQELMKKLMPRIKSIFFYLYIPLIIYYLFIYRI